MRIVGVDPKKEIVTLQNRGTQPVDLTMWEIWGGTEDEPWVYSFPDGFTLAPGATVRVHTFEGEDTQTDLYWNLSPDEPSEHVWENGKHEAILVDHTGEEVQSFRY